MGANIAAGELLQLYVPGGWWKASEIPAEDLQGVEGERKDRVGCLISEVVCPGWTIDQHKFLTKEKASRGGFVWGLIFGADRVSVIAEGHVAWGIRMGRISKLHPSRV